jgi:hypothetical protein
MDVLAEGLNGAILRPPVRYSPIAAKWGRPAGIQGHAYNPNDRTFLSMP